MGINDVFDIQFAVKLVDSRLSIRLLVPTDFFDMEYVVTRELAEIRCTSPWNHDYLQDYLGQVMPQDLIQWLQIDIVDRRNNEHRRVTEQHWKGHWISVDWVKNSFSEPTCVSLLHVKETIGEKWQHIKIQLSPLVYEIRGHWVTSGGTHRNPESTVFVEGYEAGPGRSQ